MYYVWEKDFRLTSKFACFNKEPDGYSIDVWPRGESLLHDPPHLTLETDEDRPTALSDLLLTSSSYDLQFFSPKLVRLFDRIGVKNIAYYPVTVINHETGDAITNYKAAHIIGKIPCLDIQNSKYEYFSDSEDIMFLEEFTIFEEKITPLREGGEKPLIFRLAEFEYIIVVAEIIKSECEKEGITGVKFTKPSEYV